MYCDFNVRLNRGGEKKTLGARFSSSYVLEGGAKYLYPERRDRFGTSSVKSRSKTYPVVRKIYVHDLKWPTNVQKTRMCGIGESAWDANI